jgi:hypothetical protein
VVRFYRSLCFVPCPCGFEADVCLWRIPSGPCPASVSLFAHPLRGRLRRTSGHFRSSGDCEWRLKNGVGLKSVTAKEGGRSTGGILNGKDFGLKLGA